MSGQLSDDKRKEFDQYYQNRDNLPICPDCQTNSDVIPTVRGKPTQDLSLYAEEGHVKLSGCTKSSKGWCKKCEKFL